MEASKMLLNIHSKKDPFGSEQKALMFILDVKRIIGTPYCINFVLQKHSET